MLIILVLGGGIQRGQVSLRRSDTFMSTGHTRNIDITFSISALPIAGHLVFPMASDGASGRQSVILMRALKAM